MNKIVGIATGIGIAIIVGIIVYQISGTMWERVSIDEYYEKGGKVPGVIYPENPQLLGPLQINKDKYMLGENVYVFLRDLKPGDKGTILFLTPENIVYDEWGFNGSERESQKKYFKPQLLKSKNICDKEKLIGEWTVMFKGYDMAKIHFEITNEILPRQEIHFEECNIAYIHDEDPTLKP
tara:strand:+ start:194 stop:733 length:540 start_codon:yes stop_codon:yes gene_type:complete